MSNKVLVTGKTGQLGQSLMKIADRYTDFEFTFVDRQQMDLSSPDSINEFLADKQFDYILNAGAYTAVDKAESEPELAEQINHLAVKQLAQWAKQHNAYLVQISTDYVFDGRHFKPYKESHSCLPVNHYGQTKFNAEAAIIQANTNASIIRTSWVYSEYGNNFVKTMLNLGKQRESLNVIYEQIGSPTYAGDLADAMLQLIFQHHHATHSESGFQFFHYSNEGVCSWYDFARTILELSDIACKVQPIETKDYPTPANRPYFSVLNKSKIRQKLNITIPYWKASLQTCLQNMKDIKNG